jgi:membrane fusion protein YbhG
MKNRAALVALLVVAVALAGVAAYFAARAHGSARALTLYGNVDIREASLGFRVGGRVLSLAVDEGDEVHAGEILGRLDADVYRADLREAQARGASARARRDLLRAGFRREQIAQAAAELAARRAELARADSDLERQNTLRGSGASSARNYEAARSARDEARAQVDAAAASLRLSRAGNRPEEIAQAQADLREADAVAAQRALQVEDTVLRAPADGVILTRAAEPGAVLGPGEPVFTLSLLRPVWVRAYVDEPDLGRVRPGGAVELTTDAAPGRVYHGRVGYVSPTAEFTPKEVETPNLRTDLVFRLRIVVADPDDRLRQGLPVTVTVPAGPDGAAKPPAAASDGE